MLNDDPPMYTCLPMAGAVVHDADGGSRTVTIPTGTEIGDLRREACDGGTVWRFVAQMPDGPIRVTFCARPICPHCIAARLQ